MKVCFLTPSLQLHGGTLVMFKYAGHLASRGHEVEIVCPKESVECSVPDGVKLVFYEQGRFGFHCFRLVSLFQVARCLRRGFDGVILIHKPLGVHASLTMCRRL